jgi:hypothetical protein
VISFPARSSSKRGSAPVASSNEPASSCPASASSRSVRASAFALRAMRARSSTGKDAASSEGCTSKRGSWPAEATKLRLPSSRPASGRTVPWKASVAGASSLTLASSSLSPTGSSATSGPPSRVSRTGSPPTLALPWRPKRRRCSSAVASRSTAVIEVGHTEPLGARASSNVPSTTLSRASPPSARARASAALGTVGGSASRSRGRTSCTRRGSTRPASNARVAMSTSTRSASNRDSASVAARSPRTKRSMVTRGRGKSSSRTAPWNSTSSCSSAAARNSRCTSARIVDSSTRRGHATTSATAPARMRPPRMRTPRTFPAPSLALGGRSRSRGPLPWTVGAAERSWNSKRGHDAAGPALVFRRGHARGWARA